MTQQTFRKSSIKDVARRAGVSTTTVSYFVNGHEGVCAAETAQRIRAAVAELQYTPSFLTRSLRHRATRTIGVCLYSPLDPELRYGNLFFERLWRGIVAESDAADYSLLHYPASVRDGRGTDGFLDGRVDGLLFHGLDAARARTVVRAGMPAVTLMLSRRLPDGCATAYADEDRTVGLALEHLFGLGHRRIAHLAGPARPHPSADTGLDDADEVALSRLESYAARMRAADLFDPALIGYADAWRDVDDRVAEVLSAWLALPEPPTAVFCANDALSVALMAAATARGLRVPDSLSVVGVDDSAEACAAAAVPLTSVAVPLEEVGREAVRLLLRRMGGEPAAACRAAVPVTEIVVRGSTGGPRRLDRTQSPPPQQQQQQRSFRSHRKIRKVTRR